MYQRASAAPDYTQLYDMKKRLGSRGLEVLAFPCNQFGRQEPGLDEEIFSFVQDHFGPVPFPMFSKIEVNGKNEHPIWTYLKEQFEGKVKWNFEVWRWHQRGYFRVVLHC